jgi:ribosome biogenesis SPOUT family RNA methylase Rps3
MIVKTIKEHEDGSADVELQDMTPEEMQLIMQEGFISLLKKAIEYQKEQEKLPALLKEKPSA